MTAILGIDAAWTAGNRSGVALVVERHGTWRCAGVAPSYLDFIALAKDEAINWSKPRPGSEPDIDSFIAAAEQLAGGERPGVVAVDMPIATNGRIIKRRKADKETSERFGKFGCPVHSPTKERPGKFGERFMRALEDAGYPLSPEATDSHTRWMQPTTIEVYPHAAIVRLMRLKKRLKYKVGRSWKLWHGEPVTTRIGHLLEAFRKLKAALDRKIAGIDLPLPALADVRSLSSLKAYEDALDALVCAWVGICYLEGRAEALGDETAAIWVPTKEVRSAPSRP